MTALSSDGTHIEHEGYDTLHTVVETGPPSRPLPTEAEGYMPLTEDKRLWKKVIRHGQGATPESGCSVKVHYVGTLWDNGVKFDSSRDRQEYFTFVLGEGRVIKGWDIGVGTMVVGECVELICASDYAYGDVGSPPNIPPKATLKFEVELFGFEREPKTPQEKLDAAKEKKDLGNDMFASGQYQEALSHYEKGLEYVRSFYDLPNDKKRKANELKVALLSNLMNVNNKLGHYQATLTHGSTLLQEIRGSSYNKKPIEEVQSPENVERILKALYRLAIAYRSVGKLDAAMEKLKEAQGLSEATSEDPAIMKEISLVKQAKVIEQQQQRLLYERMSKAFT